MREDTCNHVSIRQDIVAYSAMEEYELEEYAAGIEATHPDLHLHIERASTAALLDRLLTEGDNGQWDLIFGWALTTMLDDRLQPLFAPLHLPGLSGLPPNTRDPAGRWYCPSAFVPAFCLNDERLAARGLPVPTSWADLANPCYRNEVVIPDPRYSGAGFLHLIALLQSAGEAASWPLLSRVAANCPRIERSAFAPCLAVAKGEASVGATVSIAAERMTRLGLPVHMVIPADAAGTEPEGFAIRAGSPRQEGALRALAWMFTPVASLIYRKYSKIDLIQFRSKACQDWPTALFPVDIGRAAASKIHVCGQWSLVFQPELAIGRVLKPGES